MKTRLFMKNRFFHENHFLKLENRFVHKNNRFFMNQIHFSSKNRFFASNIRFVHQKFHFLNKESVFVRKFQFGALKKLWTSQKDAHREKGASGRQKIDWQDAFFPRLIRLISGRSLDWLISGERVGGGWWWSDDLFSACKQPDKSAVKKVRVTTGWSTYL